MQANVSGGIPPYSILWSTGATTTGISGLAPGTYSVTVTDGLGNTDTDATTITMVNTGMNGLTITSSLPDCGGFCSGSVVVNIGGLQGTPPYTYDPEPTFVNGNQVRFGGLCSGSLDLTITDANGCSGYWNYWAGHVYGADLAITDLSDACGSQQNGAFVVEVIGDPLSFFPSEHCITVTAQVGGQPIAEFELVEEGTLLTVEDLAPGTYVVSSITCTEMGQNLCPGATVLVTIGSVPAPCGIIRGTIYHDANEDCVFNGFDLPLPYRIIAIEPIGSFAISDDLGNYQQNLPYGNYDILYLQSPNEVGICPAVAPQPVTIDGFNNEPILDFANLSTAPHDLYVGIWSGTARPGFPTWTRVIVNNPTAFPSGDVTLSVGFDPLLSDLNNPNGQWDLGVIPPYSSVKRYLSGTVPANINLLGTVMNYTATVANTAIESTLANNIASLDVTIAGSYDPNDKIGTANISRSTTQYFLDTDEWIDYTVRFQNTGTDTAFTVVIRDEIEQDLDLMSLEILGASHEFIPSFGEGRELVFTFSDILLPDSTTDLLGSQGFVAFRMKPSEGLLPGDTVTNIANIYFDFNPPIITEPSVLVAEFSTRMAEIQPNDLRISPNPTTDIINLRSTGNLAMSGVELLSIDGRTLTVPMRRQGQLIELDVRSLASGTYLIRTAKGQGRFMKQ